MTPFRGNSLAHLIGIGGLAGKCFRELAGPEVLNILEEKQGESRIREAPPKLEDDVKQKEDELEEINLGTKEEKRPLFINKLLEKVEKEELISLLREFKDVFAWSYEEIARTLTIFSNT